MIQRIIKHVFGYTLAGQLPMLMNLFLLPFTTPYLSTGDYAVNGLIYAYTGLASAFSSLGFIVLFQNSFFKQKENYKREWGELLGFQMLYKVLYGLIIATLLNFALKESIGNDRIWGVMALVVIPVVMFDLTKSVGMRWCQFSEKHQRVYFISIASGISSGLLSAYLIIFQHAGFIGWLVGLFIGNFIQFIYYFYLLYIELKIKPSFTMPWSKIKSNLAISTPLIPKEYATYALQSSDRVLLDQINVDEKSIGQYNLAYAFSGYFEALNAQINQVLTPLFFKQFRKNNAEGDRLVRVLCNAWLGVAVVIATFLGLWVQDIFQLLYRRAELAEAYPLAIVLVFTFCYRPFYVAVVDKSIFQEQTLRIVYLVVIAAVVNVLINVILIPGYGVYAATGATVIGYFTMGILGFYLIPTGKQVRSTYRPLLCFFALGLYMLLIFFIGQQALYIRLLSSSVILILLVAIFVYNKKNWKKLLSELSTE